MLSVTDVSYEYASGTEYAVQALDGVNLTVSPGRILLVAGRTGSGKTTLLRLLAGLQSPTSGRVAVDGEAPRPASREEHRRVGLMFQSAEAQLFADTVLSDVAFGPQNLGAGDEVADAMAATALERVGLDPAAFADRSPFTLSGGEARRVALAGVLALEPRYLLLDEPAAGLDAQGRAAVRRALQDASRTAGVVVVTHDLGELLDLAHDILVLDEGRAVFSGTVSAFVQAAADGTPGIAVPEVVEAQIMLRGAGLALPVLSVSPSGAAEAVAGACRR